MARRKTREQIEAQAERLSEANWRRRNTWSGGGAESRRAKESRDRLIARAERNTLRSNGLGLSAG